MVSNGTCTCKSRTLRALSTRSSITRIKVFAVFCCAIGKAVVGKFARTCVVRWVVVLDGAYRVSRARIVAAGVVLALQSAVAGPARALEARISVKTSTGAAI